MKRTLLLFGILGIVLGATAQNTFPANGDVGIGIDPKFKLHMYMESSPNSSFPSVNSKGDIIQLLQSYNNVIEIGNGRKINERKAWILARHSQANYGQFYSTLHLQPDIGDKSQYRGVAIGFGANTYVTTGTHLAVNGNVGIGTSAPKEAKFVINKSSAPGLSGNKTGAIAILGRNTELAIGASPEINGASWIQTRHKDVRYPNSAYALTLNPLGGNVGIGTSNPKEAKFVINKSSAPGLSGNKTGAIAILGRNTELAIGASPEINGASWIQIRHKDARYSNSAYTLALNPLGGNVGVGTTSPDYKLDVAGTIRACEVKVDLKSGECPDYVFSEDYNLMKLEAVEDYINKNSHLPGIKPASEMEAEGMGLKEMNVKLLEKMEEMTLYMIEINKKVKSLDAENSNLKEEIKELKSKK